MGNSIRTLASLILVVAVCVLCFHAGRRSAGMPVFDAVTVSADTLVVHDTVTREKPVLVHLRHTDTMLVPVVDTVRIRDTVFMALPMEQRVYGDSTYRAVVSGYRPSLDTISVYPVTRYITVTQAVRSPRRKNGLEVSAGPMMLDGLHVPVLADYWREVFPWLDVGAGAGYDPVSGVPVIRASARVRLSW